MKNKVAPPFRTADVDIMYGEGISKEGEVLDMAVELDIVQKSGAWYSYNEERLGQGRENSKTFLKENKEILNEISFKVRKHYGIDSDAPRTVTETEDDDFSPLED